jgi:magnesium-transporting ATPase (P-type)
VGGATTGIVPFNVIQMLWANLVMDILAAIAIATEPYSKDIENHNRVSRKEVLL